VCVCVCVSVCIGVATHLSFVLSPLSRSFLSLTPSLLSRVSPFSLAEVFFWTAFVGEAVIAWYPLFLLLCLPLYLLLVYTCCPRGVVDEQLLSLSHYSLFLTTLSLSLLSLSLTTLSLYLRLYLPTFYCLVYTLLPPPPPTHTTASYTLPASLPAYSVPCDLRYSTVRAESWHSGPCLRYTSTFASTCHSTGTSPAPTPAAADRATNKTRRV